MKSFLLMSAMIVAAPALAQTTAPAPATSPTATAPTATAPAQPVTDAPTASTAPATTSTAQPAPAGNPSDAVAAVVASDWSKYDLDKNEALSKAEFTAWMTALREANPAQKAQVTDVNAWTTAAFAQADTDKSNTVTKPELEGFLKG